MIKDISKRLREQSLQILYDSQILYELARTELEIARTEMEMAQGNPRKPIRLPGTPNRAMYVVYFLLLAAVACAVWLLLRRSG